ncbi:MAG TPA: hypothetical protein VIS06_23160 [Mycobacteriales bacterium]
MSYYEKDGWPEEGVLMVMPFDGALHDSRSMSAKGTCTWGDHTVPARWSVVWRGDRWATCDEHLVAFAKWELLGSDKDRPAPEAR